MEDFQDKMTVGHSANRRMQAAPQEGPWVSALMDAELQSSELSQALDAISGSASARTTWDLYHLVGESMRGGVGHCRTHDPAFVSQLRERLQVEQARMQQQRPLTGSAPTRAAQSPLAANDAWWRKVATLASVAVLAVVVWQAGSWVRPDGQAAVELAQTAQPAATVEPTPVAATPTLSGQTMLRDPRLDALLAAHRHHGVSALQVPTGFLRNATFSEADR